MTDDEMMFDVWWNLYRVRRWRETRPDAGPTPSEAYLEGFKEHAKLGWMARADLHVVYSRSASERG